MNKILLLSVLVLVFGCAWSAEAHGFKHHKAAKAARHHTAAKHHKAHHQKRA